MAGEAVNTIIFSPGQHLFKHSCYHTAEVGWCKLWSAETLCLFPSSGPFRMPCLLQAGLQPNLQHSIWMVKRNCSSGVNRALNSGAAGWMKYLCLTHGSLFLSQSQRLISTPSYIYLCGNTSQPIFINNWVNKHSFKSTGIITPTTATILHIIYQPPTIRYGRCVKFWSGN